MGINLVSSRGDNTLTIDLFEKKLFIKRQSFWLRNSPNNTPKVKIKL